MTAALVSSGPLPEGRQRGAARSDLREPEALKVGSKLDLNGTTFTVVGLVHPPLGGQSADVYIPLAQLQKLSGQKNLANVVLVRADDGDSVAAVQHEIETAVPERRGREREAGRRPDQRLARRRLEPVAPPRRRARDPRRRSRAFLLAALLTLASVGKRVREIGTLKALGWTQRLGACGRSSASRLAQGILGGCAGVVLGIGVAATAIGAFGPTLTATSTTGGRERLRRRAGRPHRHRRDLAHSAARIPILLVGFVLAVVGGLLAGAAGAFRAARLRPADALRTSSDEPVRAVNGVGEGLRTVGPGLVINALDGVDLSIEPGRVRRARGPERLRQDDAAPAPRRARPAHEGQVLFEGRDLAELRDDDLAELRLRSRSGSSSSSST